MAKIQILNHISSLHPLIQQLPLNHTDQRGSTWSVTSSKSKTQTFKRFTVQCPGFPSGFQGNHSDCSAAEHTPYAQASFNCCSPEGGTGRRRWVHFSGEQPQQQEIQDKESHSWNNKENWKVRIACPRQVILNVFGAKPQDRNWLKANYWYNFYNGCKYSSCNVPDCLSSTFLLSCISDIFLFIA